MKNISITFFVLFFTAMSLSVKGQSLSRENKNKVVHIVLFKFKEGTTTSQIQSLKNEILKQENTVSGLLENCWKTSTSPVTTKN